MRYRHLGDSGLVVSVVGLGCNNFGRRLDMQGTRAVVDAALEVGVTLFDTADLYGLGESERLLGQILEGRREQVVIATKFGADLRGDNGPDWGARGSRRYIRLAVEASLSRLRTDWIDLYQLHFPDPSTPIVETLGALHELIQEGKVRYIGSSNLAAWQIADAEHVSRAEGFTRFVSAQNEYSLLERTVEREVIPACRHFGIGLLPYYPLGSGMLTGKVRRGQVPAPETRLADADSSELLTDRAFDVVEALEKHAAERGVSLLDLSVGGLAAQPAISSVIAGATSPDQVRANVAAGEWQPSRAEMDALVSVLEPFGAAHTHPS
jgi:aryl-alcohol dehydrogenase-like predicted oxidoreductase